MERENKGLEKVAESLAGAGLISDGCTKIGEGFEGFYFSLNPNDFDSKKFVKIVAGTAEVAVGAGVAAAVITPIVSACNIT